MARGTTETALRWAGGLQCGANGASDCDSGVVFVGSLDGHLRAYDTRNGTLLWDFDTAQPFTTANGVQARGGSLNGAGPTIVGGMVYVNSGYTNAMAGNVLLAFSADSK